MSSPTIDLDQKKINFQKHEEALSHARRRLAEAQALSSRVALTHKVNLAISHVEGLEEVLRATTERGKWLLDFDYCSALLLQKGNRNYLVPVYGTALEAEIDESEIGNVLKTGQSRLICEEAAEGILQTYPSRMIVPITRDGQVIGTVQFFRQRPVSYTQDDLRVGYLLALQLASVIENSRHIHELKREEVNLRRSIEELEMHNRELESFCHTVAHDLKTPLGTIGVKVQLVEELSGQILSERARQYLDSIEGSIQTMARMIDQLLLLATLRDVNEAAGTVNVRAVLDLVLARYQDNLENERIAVVVGELPSSFGHAQWVEEVFANLVGNAIKYMGSEADPREIRIAGCADGEMTRYEVRDTGVGIAAEDQARLFEMFTRLQTVKADGFGLGLSIVQQIVTKMGGAVGVVSTPGEGSTFWFTLPKA